MSPLKNQLQCGGPNPKHPCRFFFVFMRAPSGTAVGHLMLAHYNRTTDGVLHVQLNLQTSEEIRKPHAMAFTSVC